MITTSSLPHPKFQFQQDGAFEPHPFKRNNEILILIKTKNYLVQRNKMKLFATAALATTVFAATKSRSTGDAAAGLVIEHDASIRSRSRREVNPSKSCAHAKEHRDDIFRFKSTKYGFNQCVFSTLLDYHKNNIRRAMLFIYENDDVLKQARGKDLVETTGFHGIIDDWKILTGGRKTRKSGETLNCGWLPLDTSRFALKMDLEETAIKEGFFRDCAGMCNLMDLKVHDVESAKLMVKETLNMILMIIADYFGAMAQIKGDPKELPQCVQKEGEWKKWINVKWINGKSINGKWIKGWTEGNSCTDADKCGQIIRNIFRKVSLFEEFIGSIPSLVEYDGTYKLDLTRLKDPENFRLGQHGQKHKIIAEILS